MSISLRAPQYTRRLLLAAALAASQLTFAPRSARADAPALPAASVIRDGDRIVFVGDSITGQGYNIPNGWEHQIAAALAKTHPGGAPKIVGLGGSGHTVGSWSNIAKSSREKSQTLDSKQFDVKTELDQHADVVIIMLGMNDVLSPSMNGEATGIERWAGQYTDLITTLKERTTPRVLALATVTPCTEDREGPKNRALTAMGAKLREVAAAHGAIVLPVQESLFKTLRLGRRYRPDFHVTGDMVHPNGYGHAAIAAGMLAGLGEAAAAAEAEAALAAQIEKGSGVKPPSLSYEVEYPTVPLTEDRQPIVIRYFYTGATPGEEPRGRLTVPEGWTAPAGTWTGANGEITLMGTPDRLHNPVTLECGAAKVTIDIPPAWLIGNANRGGAGWTKGNSVFEPELGKIPVDDTLSKGEGFGTPVEIAAGKPLTWKRHNASYNYIGGPAAGSVDMFAVTFGGVFETAYGARWIYCPEERVVKFKLGTQAFADGGFLTLWCGGEQIYAGQYNRDRGKIVEAKLKKGWTPLVWKANHLQWQWHFNLELDETGKTDDLRFSIVPKG